MRLGGNSKLIAHFKQYNVNSMAIKDKYATPAAGAYAARATRTRCYMLAFLYVTLYASRPSGRRVPSIEAQAVILRCCCYNGPATASLIALVAPLPIFVYDAAMYREIISALKEGRPAPTDIQPFIDEEAQEKAALQAKNGGWSSSAGTPSSTGGGGGSSTPSLSSGGGGYTPSGTPTFTGGDIRRDESDARVKREAEERLRAKFGEGGLKGQSLGYTPPGMERNSNRGGDDDFDVSKVTAFAGSAFRGLADAAKSGAKVVAEQTSTLSKKVADANVTDKLAGVATNFKTTVTDPALMENVSKTASSFWGATKGLFSTASTFVQQQLVQPASGSGGNGSFQQFNDNDRERDASSPGPSATQQRSATDRPPVAPVRAPQAAAAARAPAAGAGAGRAPSPGPAQGNTPAAAAHDDVDDAAWLAQQVAAVKIGSNGSKASTSSVSSFKPAAKSAEAGDWNTWLDNDNEDGGGDGDEVSISGAGARPAAAPPSMSEESAPKKAASSPLSTSTSASSSSAAGAAPAANLSSAASSGKPAASANEDDDFFATFGIK